MGYFKMLDEMTPEQEQLFKAMSFRQQLRLQEVLSPKPDRLAGFRGVKHNGFRRLGNGRPDLNVQVL